MSIKWLDRPEAHDYDAAKDYLTLLYPVGLVGPLIDDMLDGFCAVTTRKAKDILRASGLPLLAKENRHVVKDLAKVNAGKALSPILLVRDQGRLHIADGYHRACACYHIDENTDIHCVLGDLRYQH